MFPTHVLPSNRGTKLSTRSLNNNNNNNNAWGWRVENYMLLSYFVYKLQSKSLIQCILLRYPNQSDGRWRIDSTISARYFLPREREIVWWLEGRRRDWECDENVYFILLVTGAAVIQHDLQCKRDTSFSGFTQQYFSSYIPVLVCMIWQRTLIAHAGRPSQQMTRSVLLPYRCMCSI